MLRILVADDETLHNLALSALLEDLGHEVVGMAEDGNRAVELARHLRPDLVFLDFRMPGLTGPEVASRIVAERPVPTIILSAYSDEAAVREAAVAPVFHYLVKPIAAEDLGPAIAIARARFEDWMCERDLRAATELKLEERKLVERAKGLIMQARQISEAEAHRLLQRTSQDRNVRMIEVARQIILIAESRGADSVRDLTSSGAFRTRQPGAREIRRPETNAKGRHYGASGSKSLTAERG